MKNRALIFTLISTLIFSSACFADWEKVSVNHFAAFYVNFGTIRKVDEYVYYWELGDLFKAIGTGVLSVTSHNQGNCKSFQRKTLRHNYHKEPMGVGHGEFHSPKNPKWVFPPRNSVSEAILKSVCEYAK